ncbi:MAG: RluA family pseudouridine synthase [Planctomycetota bacterium]|nr:RluA family pseudouridine synthase [Planctomycetota bacterium]
MGLLPKDRDLNRPQEQVELVVDASDFQVKVDELVLRLDHFLGEHLTWRSRNSIQKLVRDGFVLVDASSPDHPEGTGTSVVEKRPGRKLRHGTRVIVVIPEDLRLKISPEEVGPLDILYEDEEVVALDKPPLVAVHPSGRHMADTLIQRVHAHFREEVESGRMVPRLCHRLDRETSGIVLVAKHVETHPGLMGQFENRQVGKAYLALVHDVGLEQCLSITDPIGQARASDIRLKMAVRADGLPSRTDIEVLERADGISLVRCDLFTGRQHQIRVHLAARGAPIVGDKLYGSDDTIFLRSSADELTAQDRRALILDRHALHNHYLRFTSPAAGEVQVTSPLPPDMAALLEARRDS